MGCGDVRNGFMAGMRDVGCGGGVHAIGGGIWNGVQDASRIQGGGGMGGFRWQDCGRG